jgi:hypothetical protein
MQLKSTPKENTDIFDFDPIEDLINKRRQGFE